MSAVSVLAVSWAIASAIVPIDDPGIVAVGAAERDAGPGLLLRFSSAGVRLHASGTVRLIWATGSDFGAPDDDADEGGGNRFVATVVHDGDGATREVEVGDSGVVEVDAPATITIVKVTEGLFGARRLLAVDIDGALLPPPPPRPTLVVLGDSWATGFGVLGDVVDTRTGVAPGPNCPFTPSSQDVRAAWPTVVAAALGADAAVVAWSGRGVVRDYEGDLRPPTVPQLYAESLVSPSAVVGVVIALGGNDGTPGLPEASAFRAAWQALVARLQRDFPTAPLIALTPDFDDEAPAIDRGAAFAGLMAHEGVAVVAGPKLDDSLGRGCVWHPGTRAQRDLAQQVLTSVGRRLRARAAKP